MTQSKGCRHNSKRDAIKDNSDLKQLVLKKARSLHHYHLAFAGRLLTTFDTFMARTKQTACKATGGSAGHVKLLIGSTAGNSSAVGRQDDVEVCEGFRHNDFCIICRDDSVDDDFLLLVSIGTTSRYWTCSSLSVLPSTSQLSSDTLLFVHLTLVDYDTIGTSFELAHQFLMPYFPNASMEYHKVTFDVGTTSKVKTYEDSMAALVDKLSSTTWSRIVFGISNHTGNSSGDPFVGYERKTYVATPVHDFLAIILGPWQALIDRALESFLWLFSCGALVNNAKSFSNLCVLVAHHGVSAAIAFNAVRFQPSFSAHLLLAFCELVLIQRHSIQQAFPDMLGQSYKLGCHSDVFLLLKHNINSVDVFRYYWTHSHLRPWGNFLPLQCPDCGLVDSWNSANHQKEYSFECQTRSHDPRRGHMTMLVSGHQCYTLSVPLPTESQSLTFVYTLRIMSSDWTLKFKSILDQFEQDFQSNKDSSTHRSHVVKKVKNAIFKAQGDHPGVTLLSSLKKAIQTYYYEMIDSDSEKSDKEAEPDVEDEPVVTVEEREAAAHPKTAVFYKKECNEWDVAQKLFKQEINDYNKAERARKELDDSIKHRMGHAREWFKKMTAEQEKEVKDAMEKWNKEGAPEEIQAVLKKFRRNYAAPWVAELHESKPQSVKKKFSVSSDSIKEWSSTGFELFAEWSKTEFYPTDEDQDDLEIDDSDKAEAEPELILDEEGYAKLPSRQGVALRGQQDLIKNIFLASYKVFTKSNRLVPWRQIVANAPHYLEVTCVPETLVVRDPSHMRLENSRSLARKKLVIFINAKKGDKMTKVADKGEGKKRKTKDYVEVFSSDEAEVNLASSDSTKGRIVPASDSLSIAPASVLFNEVYDERWVFLRGLSMDDNYLELVDATQDLATSSEQMTDHSDWPSWAKWSWRHDYIPKDIHESQKMLEASLKKLRTANISNATSAISVVLGLGMLFRECKRVIEYEEDEAPLDTSAYLANFVFDLSFLHLLEGVVSDVLSSVVGIIELQMRDRYLQNEEDENTEGKQGEVSAKVQDIEMEQEKEEDTEVEEKEEEEKVEVKQTGKKRTRTQVPSRNSKRAKTEPKVSSNKSKKSVKAKPAMRHSTRARQPTKKNANL
ncbi:hypothetical protein EV424DRAFT_1347668 [Suillus variegatus]|nr:hypothetical protein EV424DRAFT_1347668 [Suillus variegatus]